MHTYIKTYLSVFLILFIAIILFNGIIDPYAIHPKQWISIEHKPAAQTHVRLAKAHAITEIQPETIILGSSRAAVGLNPAHPCLQDTKAYNLGLDGINMREMYYYFMHAYHQAPLQQVILSLDFMSFNIYMEDKPDFSLKRLKTNPNQFTYEPEFLSAHFSWQATIDSLQTLLRKFDPTLPAMNNKGLTLESALYKYKAIHGGHHNTAIISENSYISDVWLPRKNPKYAFQDPLTGESTLDYFQKILDYCYENNIKVTIAIAPSHIRHGILIQQLGLWDRYLSWKRNITLINEDAAAKYAKLSYPLWDFSTMNDITTEPFPAVSEADANMQWYWESSHYNQTLGDLMLNKMLCPSFAKEIVPNFGILLNGNNIEASLKNETNDYAAYIKDHGTLYLELSELIAENRELLSKL